MTRGVAGQFMFSVIIVSCAYRKIICTEHGNGINSLKVPKRQRRADGLDPKYV